MKKESMIVGYEYTNNDGNNCESEITIKRIADKYSGPDTYYGDTEHEEFELQIQTPRANKGLTEPDEQDNTGEKLILSRDNLENLKELLKGIDLSSDTPTVKTYW